ncbi:MAG: hypothetical protein KDF54_12485, partial [Hydrogenophaga sp.]|nr:hypothetical protein [Hydrogenophaga sp.]
MSNVFSPVSPSLGAPGETRGVYRPKRHFDGARGLAAMLLAAAVAALVVLADQMIGSWADGHLFLGWVTLWVVIFAGSALFAGTARNLAKAALRSLDGWSRSMAESRAEARLWDLARHDPRLKSELMQARARESEMDEALEVSRTKKGNDYADALAPLGLDTG